MQMNKKVHSLKIPFQILVTQEKSIDRFVYMPLILGEKIHLDDVSLMDFCLTVLNELKLSRIRFY